MFETSLLLALVGLSLAVLALVLVVARRLAAQNRALLAAVELAQKQLTELRSQQDQISVSIASFGDRQAQLEQKLEVIERHTGLDRVRRQVELGRESAALGTATASRLDDELRKLQAENATRSPNPSR